MSQPFKLTYTDDKNLYIAVGYGAQPTGGYSISIRELYLTENSIVLATELMGPEKGKIRARSSPSLHCTADRAFRGAGYFK